jgi:hypothetical protein
MQSSNHWMQFHARWKAHVAAGGADTPEEMSRLAMECGLVASMPRKSPARPQGGSVVYAASALDGFGPLSLGKGGF